MSLFDTGDAAYDQYILKQKDTAVKQAQDAAIAAHAAEVDLVSARIAAEDAEEARKLKKPELDLIAPATPLAKTRQLFHVDYGVPPAVQL